MDAKLLYFTLVFFSLITGCKQELEPTMRHHVVSGVIPMRIVNTGNIFGQDDINFSYTNCEVQQIGIESYRYENGKVSRIYIGVNRFMKFEYNEADDIRRIEHFIRFNREEEFFMNDEKLLMYTNGIITQFEDVDDAEMNVVYYNSNSGNADSIEVYNDQNVITKTFKYEYDTMNNVYLNMKVPLFGALEMIEKGNRNNITKKSILSFDANSSDFTISYDYTYNDDGFPEFILPSGSSFGPTRVDVYYQSCE